MLRFVVSAVRLDYDDSRFQFLLWSPDGLPMAGENLVVDLAAVLESDLMGELWRRLDLLADEHDSEVA